MIPTLADLMQLTSSISGYDALTDADALALYNCLIQVPANGIVVETGCQLGRSSSLIAQLAKAIGFHSIHIDPYCAEPPGVASPAEDYLQRWVTMMRRIGGEQGHEFTLLCMRTEQAEWLLGRLGQINLAFIDGDHELDGVLTDCDLVASRVCSGGWLCVHDYANEGLAGVKQGIGQYIKSEYWEDYGVNGSLATWRRR